MTASYSIDQLVREYQALAEFGASIGTDPPATLVVGFADPHTPAEVATWPLDLDDRHAAEVAADTIAEQARPLWACLTYVTPVLGMQVADHPSITPRVRNAPLFAVLGTWVSTLSEPAVIARPFVLTGNRVHWLGHLSTDTRYDDAQASAARGPAIDLLQVALDEASQR